MAALVNYIMIAFGVMIVVFSAIICGFIIGMIHDYNHERAMRKEQEREDRMH